MTPPKLYRWATPEEVEEHGAELAEHVPPGARLAWVHPLARWSALTGPGTGSDCSWPRCHQPAVLRLLRTRISGRQLVYVYCARHAGEYRVRLVEGRPLVLEMLPIGEEK